MSQSKESSRVAQRLQSFVSELEGGINTALFARKEYYKGDTYDDFGDIYNNRGITAFPHLSLSVSYIIK